MSVIKSAEEPSSRRTIGLAAGGYKGAAGVTLVGWVKLDVKKERVATACNQKRPGSVKFGVKKGLSAALPNGSLLPNGK